MDIRTILFEDTKFDVNAFKYLLERIPGVRIIKIVDTLNDAIAQCVELKPDLILADADIRGDKTVGPIFVRTVKQVLPGVKILGVTRWPECLGPMKTAGCNQVVLKQFLDNEKEAEKFIREVLLEIPNIDHHDHPPELSQLEDQVLRGIADGKTEQELAEELSYSHRQIRRVKETLFEKFDSTKDTQLVSMAYQKGYLSREK